LPAAEPTAPELSNGTPLPSPRSQVPPRVQSYGQDYDMRGVITGKDVFRHSLTVVRLYGARCYLRCLRASMSSKPTTFLEVVFAA
jgi:hypothetical protein